MWWVLGGFVFVFVIEGLIHILESGQTKRHSQYADDDEDDDE